MFKNIYFVLFYTKYSKKIQWHKRLNTNFWSETTIT